MADLDKVLKGLAHCTGTNGCFECPYSDDGYSATVHCKVQVDRDALELLKSQQAKMDAMFRMLKSRGKRIKELTARNEKLYNDWLSLAEK